MTREEAIKKIKKVIEESVIFEDELEAFDIAIKALEHPEKNVVAVVPCGDAISRQAVLNAMYELCDTGETLKENPWRDNPHIDAVVEAIEELPSVTPQPKMGHWIFDEILDKHYYCSECKSMGVDYWDYCPNCGARMEVEE